MKEQGLNIKFKPCLELIFLWLLVVPITNKIVCINSMEIGIHIITDKQSARSDGCAIDLFIYNEITINVGIITPNGIADYGVAININVNAVNISSNDEIATNIKIKTVDTIRNNGATANFNVTTINSTINDEVTVYSDIVSVDVSMNIQIPGNVQITYNIKVAKAIHVVLFGKPTFPALTNQTAVYIFQRIKNKLVIRHKENLQI